MSIEFVDRSKVTLVQSNASDDMVAMAAWVSFDRDSEERPWDRGKVGGLINFLARENHSCYSDDTEIFTDGGWKLFSNLGDSDKVLSLDPTSDKVKFTPTERVVSYDYDGDLISISAQSVDIMVTPNHLMFSAPRQAAGFKNWSMNRADGFLNKSHRIRLGGGVGPEGSQKAHMKLLGFFLGDGTISKDSPTPQFNLRKQRKIDYLEEIARLSGAEVSVRANGSRSIVGLSRQARLDLLACYNQDGEKIIPEHIIKSITADGAKDIIEGLWNADGSRSGGAAGTKVVDSTSKTLLDQIQGLAPLAGMTVSVNKGYERTSEYGTYKIWRAFFLGRNARSKIGFTKQKRNDQVTRVSYSGKVWCVTVPTGIVYVRRNGKAMWCGNSPFEHGQFTFKIETPIFVAREFHRHRTMCIDGDTKVSFSNGKSKTIRDHWEHWNLGVLDTMGRRRILPSVKSSTVVSVNEETMEIAHSKVLDVIKGQPKEMFRIVTNRGFESIASADHKFMTENGWITVKEMVAEETQLMVRHKRLSASSTHTKATPSYLRSAINSWSNSQKDSLSQTCICGGIGIIVDHVIPVAKSLKHALDVDNLQMLCADCNRSKTGAEQSYADRKMKFDFVSPDIVVRIDSAGVRDSYDLVLDNPHHNFFGNGMVTHNSYNEVSGRYTEMKPRFYVPPASRPLVQQGKAGAYMFVGGTPHQIEDTNDDLQLGVEESWNRYQKMLKNGIAKEVARMVLPLNMMTQFYATANPLNLIKFLGLRTNPQALFEIRDVAWQMDAILKEQMPLTYEAWRNNG